MIWLLLLVGSPALISIYIICKMLSGLIRWLLVVAVLAIAVLLFPLLWHFQLPDPAMHTQEVPPAAVAAPAHFYENRII